MSILLFCIAPPRSSTSNTPLFGAQSKYGIYTIVPKLKKICLGKPVQFCAAEPMDAERSRICTYLMDEITAIAEALPEHTVVPYRNIPKKEYPTNRPKEHAYEKAGR